VYRAAALAKYSEQLTRRVRGWNDPSFQEFDAVAVAAILYMAPRGNRRQAR
jgi:hypothetical protein